MQRKPSYVTCQNCGYYELPTPTPVLRLVEPDVLRKHLPSVVEVLKANLDDDTAVQRVVEGWRARFFALASVCGKTLDEIVEVCRRADGGVE